MNDPEPPEELIIIPPPKFGWPWSSTIYAIRDSAGHTLIETGCGGHDAVKHTLAAMEHAGVSPQSVHTVLVSHAHPDHYGGIHALREHAPGVRILIHENEYPAACKLENMYENFNFEVAAKFMGSAGPELEQALSVRREWIFQTQCRAASTPPHETVSGNQLTTAGPFELQWILTPGHSPGHVAFFDEQRSLLFSGDLVAEAPAWYAPTAGGLTGYLNSLDTIEKLRPEVLLPSHAPPVMEPARAIDNVRRRLMQRHDRIMELIQKEPCTFRQIVEMLFNEFLHLFPGCPIVECHLQSLTADGLVVEENGVYSSLD